MKHSLATSGLSISQAQSVSNLCNQRVRDIKDRLSIINNASKTVTVNGKTYTQQPANPIPTDIVALLQEKARLSATQAFLMENIRAKDAMLKATRNMEFDYSNQVAFPVRAELKYNNQIDQVDESWGWDQLSVAEYNEYLEAEAYASHIGQFIHRGGELDALRIELPNMKSLEWITVKDGEKTPVEVHCHHTPASLAQIHEELAAMHREFEQRVNYFKAKVKNLVTAENARIARANADEMATATAHNNTVWAEFETLKEQWYAAEKKAKFQFQEQVEKETNAIAQMRIQVPERFQPVIDMFLPTDSE
jgi:head-tail adaptor